MRKTGENYPVGPCTLPLECYNCGTVITQENVVTDRCDGECELCLYCGEEKCPQCGNHWHCGGCI